MGLLLGMVYSYLWFSSIFAGYAFLFCPLVPFVFLSTKFYRFIADIILTFWQYYPTALLELLCGTEIQVTGDAVRSGETSVLISNHRTRTDWNFLWPTMFHAVQGKRKLCHGSKFILKDVIRHFVGPGWVMQLAGYIFIKRNWTLDKKTIKNYTDYVAESKYKHSMILFPEGTDFTEKTKKSSDSFAEKNGLTKYDYVLLPRTTGFCFMVDQMIQRECMDALYDVTLVYPDFVPQNEKILFSGNFPKTVKVHMTRYPVQTLPASEEGLKDFLEKRWLEKEKALKHFFTTGSFLQGKVLNPKNGKLNFELYSAFFFWTLLPYLVLYLLYISYLFRYIVCVHTMFLVTLNMLSDGFSSFEIHLFNVEQRIKKWFFSKL